MRTFPNPQSPGSVGRLIPDKKLEKGGWTALLPRADTSDSLSSLRLPLRFGGFSPGLMQTYAPTLQQLGFEPMQGGMLAGSPSPAIPGGTTATPDDLAPGRMISVMLVKGDLNMNVDCTITYRQGPKL